MLYLLTQFLGYQGEFKRGFVFQVEIYAAAPPKLPLKCTLPLAIMINPPFYLFCCTDQDLHFSVGLCHSQPNKKLSLQQGLLCLI